MGVVRYAPATVRRQLTILIATTTFVAIACVAATLWQLGELRSAHRALEDRLIPAQVVSNSLDRLVRVTDDQARAVRDPAMPLDPAMVANAARSFDALVAQARPLLVDEPELSGQLDALDGMGQHWFDELEAVTAAATPVIPSSVAEDEFADLADRIDELSEQLTDRISTEHDQASRASTAILVMLLVTAGVLAASAAVSYLIIRHSITRPLRRLVDQISTVADGGLGQSIEATGPVDLVQVGDAAERMRRRLLADAERRTESALIAGHLAESALMAGQLHDDQVQAMTLVSIRLQQIARKVGDDPVLADAVAQASDATTRAIERLRRLIFDLHSPVLDSEGLVAALEVYVDETFDDTVRTSVRGDSGPIDDATGGLAYRLAREAVFNSFKHASASTVNVTVEARAGSLVVMVSDDGIGFERAAGELPEPTPGHLGMRHAAELADAAGGRWDVRSEPGAGTIVTITLPTRTAGSDVDVDGSLHQAGSAPAISPAAAGPPRSTRGG